jgi:hypothetical protein
LDLEVSDIDGRVRMIMLHEVQHVPELQCNLFSMNHVLIKGFKVDYQNNMMILHNNNIIIPAMERIQTDGTDLFALKGHRKMDYGYNM